MLLGLLLALATGAQEAVAIEPVPDSPAKASLRALGPLAQGESALTVEAGRPFYSLRLDRGLGSRIDAGVGVDLATAGFVRPLLRARLRLLTVGSLQLVARGTLGVALPQSHAGYGPRAIVRTEDGELAVACDWAFSREVAGFVEAAVLGETDFTSEHSASQLEGTVGVALAPLGPLSLLAQVGVLRGSRGMAMIGSGGVVFRF